MPEALDVRELGELYWAAHWPGFLCNEDSNYHHMTRFGDVWQCVNCFDWFDVVDLEQINRLKGRIGRLRDGTDGGAIRPTGVKLLF